MMNNIGDDMMKYGHVFVCNIKVPSKYQKKALCIAQCHTYLHLTDKLHVDKRGS